MKQQQGENKMKKKIEVIQDEESPIDTKVIAQSIVDISRAMKVLSGGRLKRDAILTLVKDKTGIPKKTIGLVIESLESMERDWLK